MVLVVVVEVTFVVVVDVVVEVCVDVSVTFFSTTFHLPSLMSCLLIL